MFAVRSIWPLAVMAALLWGATARPAYSQESPPGRVARISYIGGRVAFEPAGTHAWVAAELNWPMSLGDRIWTDWTSRAEIEVGTLVIRLGSRTGFSFLNLTGRIAQMQLSAGTIIVHVRSLGGGARDEVDTPNLAIELERPGTYQVRVSPSGETTVVAVLRGAARAAGGGEIFTIAQGQRARFRGAETLTVAYHGVGSPDALERWSMSRDRQEAQSAVTVTQYVSPAMVGIYDLDTYGSWADTQWGYAWFPNVDVGWTPYRFGHWVWIFPWGWTWIDAEPWGFAPFHYGRWGFWHGAWCWIPGPAWQRPVYAPALVAWVHGGPAGRGAVGWVPLGPRNVYIPGYAASAAYVRRVNLSNTRALNLRLIAAALAHRAAQSFRNGRVAGAITAVPRAAFVDSESVAAHRLPVPRRGLRALRLSVRMPALAPRRASAFGARAPQFRAAPPWQLTNRAVVARLLPPRAPVSFRRQQAAIRANGGRTLTFAQWARLRPNMPAARVRLAQVLAAPPRRSPSPHRSAGGFVPPRARAYRPFRMPSARDRPQHRFLRAPRLARPVPRPSARGPVPPRVLRPHNFWLSGPLGWSPKGGFWRAPPPMYRPLAPRAVSRPPPAAPAVAHGH